MNFTIYSAQLLDQQRAADVIRSAEHRRIVAERRVLGEAPAPAPAKAPARTHEVGWFGSLLRAAHLSRVPAVH
ncbi:MAG TPA: hypothetical protein VIJ18_10830 [Microbacteriaceae bacterium]